MTSIKVKTKLKLAAALLVALSLLLFLALTVGAEEAPKYTITTKLPLDRIENFRSFSATPSEAAPGETVSLCFEAYPGYQSANIKLTLEDGTLVPYRVTDRWQQGSIYRVWISFVMPEGNVQAELECVPHFSMNIARVQATGNGTVSYYRLRAVEAIPIIEWDWGFTVTPDEGYEVVSFDVVGRVGNHVFTPTSLGNGVYEMTDDNVDGEAVIRVHFCRIDRTAEPTFVNGFCSECGGYEPAAITDGERDLDGDGVSDIVYEIGNAGQLFWFADMVNRNQDNLSEAYAVLTADIVVNEDLLTADGTPRVGAHRVWTPIGAERTFAGILDGQGHTISGLYVNDETADDVGLIGMLGLGTVRNVGVVDSYFHGSHTVGGIVGSAGSATISSSYAHATVVVEGGIAGGIVGIGSRTVIEDCHHLGTVTANMSAGGLVGYYIQSTIKNSYHAGTITAHSYNGGGLMGSGGDDTLENCFSVGKIQAPRDAGGIIGLALGNFVFENCYYRTGDAPGALGAESTEQTDDGIEAKDADFFASGALALLLGDAYGQTIGTDAHPVHRTETNAVYYGYLTCRDGATEEYSNNENVSATPIAHTDENHDHICDALCGSTTIAAEAHADADLDHTCDYGCAVPIGTHADAADDRDHLCDYGCGAILEEHAYDNACDGACNICSAEREPAAHASADLDGLCDVCGTHYTVAVNTVIAIVAPLIAAIIAAFAIQHILKKRGR